MIGILVAEAAAKDFVPASTADRAVGWGTFGACAACVASEEIPVSMRVVLASIIIFSNFEYCFHRWVMHAQDGTLEQKLFGAYQTLHITHHVETLRDMQLEGGAESDPRHIYFSATTTLASVLISSAGLLALNACFHLGFGDSLGEVLLRSAGASGLVALLHTTVWQTLHGDIHEYYAEYGDGLGRLDALSKDTPYARWMVSNHVGHHVVRGSGNYNIVFPGPDYLWGTCFVPTQE